MIGISKQGCFKKGGALLFFFTIFFIGFLLLFLFVSFRDTHEMENRLSQVLSLYNSKKHSGPAGIFSAEHIGEILFGPIETIDIIGGREALFHLLDQLSWNTEMQKKIAFFKMQSEKEIYTGGILHLSDHRWLKFLIPRILERVAYDPAFMVKEGVFFQRRRNIHYPMLNELKKGMMYYRGLKISPDQYMSLTSSPYDRFIAEIFSTYLYSSVFQIPNPNRYQAPSFSKEKREAFFLLYFPHEQALFYIHDAAPSLRSLWEEDKMGLFLCLWNAVIWTCLMGFFKRQFFRRSHFPISESVSQ